MLAPAPSWRAALRIARRDALRHKGRNLLVAIMVALPVLAVSAVDVLYRTISLEPEDRVAVELGTRAQALVRAAGSTVEQSADGTQASSGDDGTGASLSSAAASVAEVERRLTVVTPAGDRILHTTSWFAAPRLRIADRSITASWWEVDLAEPGLAGLYTTTAGRVPRAGGEVAVSAALADSTGLHPGDWIDVPEAARAQAAAGGGTRVSVVGVVRETAAPRELRIVGPPGTLLPAAVRNGESASATWYVAGPAPVTWPDVLRFNAIGAEVVSRAVLLDPPPADQVPYESHREQYPEDSGSGTLAAGIVVTIALALLQIALLAGPALAVGARRNQRMLAVVISTGGERRHARRIVLANAVLVGVAASLAGAVAGAGLGALAVAVLRSSGHLVAPSIDVSPLDLAILVAVGALTALAAALVPARQAARLDVVAALTGRRPAETIRRHVPVLGALVAVAGVALTLWGAATHRTVAVILGIGLGEIGLVGTTGAAVALAARASDRLPLSLRMALRDAARQRGRTAPAVAAVMAAVAGGLAAVLYVSAQDQHDRQAYSQQSALGVVTVSMYSGDGSGRPAAEWARVEAALRSALPIERAAVMPTLQSSPGSLSMLNPLVPPSKECPTPQDRVPTPAEADALATDPRCTAPTVTLLGGSTLVDDTGDALAIQLGSVAAAQRAALAAGRVLVSDDRQIWPDGTAHLEVSDPKTGEPVKTLTLPATAMTGAVRFGGVVVPPSVAATLGGTTVTTLVAATSRMPTTAEMDRAQATLEDLDLQLTPDLQVERGYESNFGPGLLALVIAALVVALAGSLTSVGLAAAESRADAATLAAVGAAPGLRRRLAAAQAGVVVVLGTCLGTIGGVLAGYALIRLQMPPASAGWVLSPAETNGWEFVVRWPYLLAITAGIPVVAILMAFASTRSRLTLTHRTT